MNYKHLQEIVNIENKPIDYYTKKDSNKYMNLLSNLNNTLKYKSSEQENNKSICHWGQRKLFISELEFLIAVFLAPPNPLLFWLIILKFLKFSNLNNSFFVLSDDPSSTIIISGFV